MSQPAAPVHPSAAGAPRVLVTRPQPQADEWVAQLQALGVAASALPLMGIADAADPQAVRRAWASLPQRALAMFVSPSAVARFFALRPVAQSWPAHTLAGGTGPGTARALHAAGVPAALVVAPGADSPQLDSEALWALLRPLRDWSGQQALVVRGENGRDWLADTLRQHGAQVHFVEAYRRTAPVLDPDGVACLAAARARPAAHVWLFSSSEAAGHLRLLAPGTDWSQGRALASHARIAEAARRLGFGSVQLVQPSPAAVAALLAATPPSIQ